MWRDQRTTLWNWFSYLYVGLGEGQTQVVRLAWGRQQALLLAKPPSLACFQG